MTTDLTFLSELEDIIQSRIDNPSEDSYTSMLVASGEKRMAQKIGEEAIELALATVAGDAQEQLEEAADLVYHLLVLLRSRQMSLQVVSETLRQRHEVRVAR